jgi:dTDP-4-amino-4,6-dideoxygalactose transaminase
VHYGGVPCRAPELVDLAKQHGIALVEDNAHGLGGSLDGTTLGTFGALSTLSFDSQKNVTCGEGGALVVNDPLLWPQVEVARDRGTSRAQFLRGESSAYEWTGAGSNWDMGELAATVLMAQLEGIADIQRHRQHCWDTYAQQLAEWADQRGVLLPDPPAGSHHTAHIFHMRLRDRDDRDRFIAYMDERGITTPFHYHALHISEMGRRFGGREGQCPVAEHAARTLVRLPLHGGLRSRDLERVIDAVTSYF